MGSQEVCSACGGEEENESLPIPKASQQPTLSYSKATFVRLEVSGAVARLWQASSTMATPEDWQQAEEEKLRGATRLLAILEGELEQGLTPKLSPLFQLGIKPQSFPAAPLQPGFRWRPRRAWRSCLVGPVAPPGAEPRYTDALRRAVVGFAQALETVNAAVVRMFRPYSPKEEGGPDPSDLWRLAYLLQPMAIYLLRLPGIANEPSLSCTVALAGVIVTGSGSLAHRFMDRKPDSKLMRQHIKSLSVLLRFLSDVQGEALSTLRRSVFTPKVILGCLRAVLWRELQGQTGASALGPARRV